MKIALITDQHFGHKSDSLVFDAYFQQFYTNIFFPYLKDNNITRVVDLGDCFDRRKFVNFQILANVKSYFYDKLRDMGCQTDIIIGNHNTYYRNTNKINNADLLLKEYKNLTIHTSPTHISLGGMDVAIIPWINEENTEETIKFIEQSPAKIAMGHFELAGFKVLQDKLQEHGTLDSALLTKFSVVFSGHFHHRHNNGHIYYLGCPYELTFSDFNDPKGFHVFDTDTMELHFIPNPDKMYHELKYDENNVPGDLSLYKGKYLRIIIKNKTDSLRFDQFMDALQEIDPAGITIFENSLMDGLSDQDVTIDQDTTKIMDHCIDLLQMQGDKSRLKQLLHELHHEAATREF